MIEIGWLAYGPPISICIHTYPVQYPFTVHVYTLGVALAASAALKSQRKSQWTMPCAAQTHLEEALMPDTQLSTGSSTAPPSTTWTAAVRRSASGCGQAPSSPKLQLLTCMHENAAAARGGQKRRRRSNCLFGCLSLPRRVCVRRCVHIRTTRRIPESSHDLFQEKKRLNKLPFLPSLDGESGGSEAGRALGDWGGRGGGG